MYSCTFSDGVCGLGLFVLYRYECPLVVLACESLHACTVCIWRCKNARFCVEVSFFLFFFFYALYIVCSFIYSFIQ